jgi:PAS domain S-box-containing protein
MAEAMRWLVDPAQVDATGASTPGLTAAEADRHRPHVLVADDNEDMRHYIATLLNPDYEVTTAIDGMDALAKALADPPDLVLTDVMMPNIDGFGLLAALRAQPSTMGVPVVMLSARAGEDGTVEGLEAGASDYLSKPFSARELLARVKANLELDRARRTRDELQRSQLLLDQAQRLALVGNWEIDLATQAIHGSHEYFRLLGVDPEEFATGGVPAALRYLHADDAERLLEALDATVAGENALDLEFRIVPGDGGERRVRSRAELVRDDDGTPRFVRGTLQDITDQYVAQEAIKSAAAAEEAGRREHHIAAELQRSLLPQSSVSTDHLDIATFYRAGVEGTQVGGDWYDVIELGAGRTALVMGDVMGRGVRAAAVMGQLRAAVRAYARLDLPPADVLEFLDGVVRDLGEDQIVTCVYGVYDPTDNTFVFANAGHLPPLLSSATGVTRRLDSTAGAPLGTGPLSLSEAVIDVPAGALVAMYTDGLVERRDSDLDAGIDRLASGLAAYRGELDELPDSLVAELLPDGPDDDVAVLIARVTESLEEFRSAVRRIGPDEREVRATRGFVTATMNEWGIAPHLVDDIVLLVSELVTNAVIHGSAPIELRLRRSRRHVVLEVYDGAFFLPRKLRPTPDDEHGRGLQLVTILADRWGIRPTAEGKSVWCMFELDRDETVHEYDWDLVGA